MTDDTTLSRQNANGERMVEIRIETSEIEVATMDGYCAANGNNRTDVIRGLIAEWSANKRREAIMICRVAGINPNSSEYDRKDEE